jgi:hypothetical protein
VADQFDARAKLRCLAWIRDSDMTSFEKLALCTLLSRANDAAQAWPSVARIAKDMGASKRQAHRAIRALEARGIVRTSHRTLETGAASSSLFTLAIPVTASHPPMTASHPPVTIGHGEGDCMAPPPVPVGQGDGDCVAHKEIHRKQSIGSDPGEGADAPARDEASGTNAPEEKPVEGIARSDSSADPEAMAHDDWKLPASESSANGADWIAAYTRGIRRVSASFTFDPSTFRALVRVVDNTSCLPREYRPRIAEWIERDAERFARAVEPKAQYWGAFSAAGFARWHSSQCPDERVGSTRTAPKQAQAQSAAAAEWRKEADG